MYDPSVCSSSFYRVRNKEENACQTQIFGFPVRRKGRLLVKKIRFDWVLSRNLLASMLVWIYSRRLCAFSCFLCFFSSPVFFDLQIPLPLEVVVLVVIREMGVNVVSPAAGHPGGSVLHRSQITLNLSLGSIRANHQIHLVD